ncbi:MAG: YdeI/OmpD-associated family protein [Candidatus Eremiobacteraeota bacterium]|nr:YdeI/OmpD-associated family protein [Candidatus Eremiobacteraeota bacterium]
MHVRITVLDRSVVEYPNDLLAALRAESATSAFKALPPGRQNFIIRRIEEAVKPETRMKRIRDAIRDVRRPNAR